MNLKAIKILIAISLLVFVSNLTVKAQFGDKIGKTFDSSISSVVANALAKNQNNSAAKINPSVFKFTPAGESGVAQNLADALAQNAEQKTALTAAFQQIKQAYEAEVAKEGKSNNLAAAMTFFISANVMTYYQTEPPSEQITEELFKDLQVSLSNVPAFAEMTDAEKQKMHDWLVCMGGFAMTNYLDSKQSGDVQALTNIKIFADYSMRLVLGIEAEKISLSSSGLSIKNNSSNIANGNSSSVNSEIIGTWTKSSSSPVGMPGTIDATQKQMVSVGLYRARYTFNSDGTYMFKSEMSPTSNVWWTTEETGTFSARGDVLTISPKSSKAILRNLDGVVQKTENKPLEVITYKWKKHYFEGIGEMNLVLEPSQRTNRDGNIGGNSLFPNAYLYTQGDNLAWRY